MNDILKIRKAYSYQRFSSARQRDGDSLRRQSQATDHFCKEHRLTLVDTFIDKGVSAFRGKNFTDEAALGQFIKLVENGTVQKGCVLVVESMDRLPI
jgi:DNA invertase Pin-like site-specific DNA recombinase